ncbi:type IV pilin protein [Acinetobacter sp. ANC 4173]|jgi:type IV pilus assembly protein PilE|uniref:type IV pilin protein n=1 Tax=Acinetobacter sp. ANC 4173 TaxID=2529837 RepID=UPI00103F12DD|nr:type IV pilin protein [Acinetobacter sp. ANC 4173]TCB81028.1 prepilin-type N-terminal cleavage/methylation domain-containing protein [Acinetobacter sp. ANC 4173]
MNKNGFTLIELMVVVVIVAIFVAIAIPSYQAYIRRAETSKAQQELKRIATLLERHKARNFSYKGFDLSAQTLSTPRTYSFDLKDGADTTKLLNATGASGHTWVLKATTTDAKNYNYLITSTGIRCRNLTAANITYTGCGTGGEAW